MRTLGPLLAMVAMLAALAVAAPLAQADDQSVYDAWTAENSTLAKLESALGRNLKAWSRSGGSKGAPALERISRIRALVARRRQAVAAEDPSSGAGGSGRKNALAALRHYDSAMVNLRRAVRAGMDGDMRSARAYLGRYDALIERSQKYERRALAAFEDAGVA
jgi:hypothetical protein